MKTARGKCFYCGAILRRGVELDHFPVPESAGGVILVPACVSCHDMKDRTRPRDWPDDWIAKIIQDFPTLSRETKLFLAVAMRLYADTLEKVEPKSARKTSKSVKALLAEPMALASKAPKKAPSPSPEQWAARVTDLKGKKGLTTWQAICDLLRIETAGGSARRKLKNWVKTNRPAWPSVPELGGD